MIFLIHDIMCMYLFVPVNITAVVSIINSEQQRGGMNLLTRQNLQRNRVLDYTDLSGIVFR